MRDLPLKRHERVFHERVPLPPSARTRIQLSDEWRYAQLATLVEAWGFRASHEREQLLSREEMALRVVPGGVRAGRRGAARGRRRRRAGPRPSATCASRCSASCCCTRHDWTDDVVERLLGEVRAPGVEDDTMVHQILKEMR